VRGKRTMILFEGNIAAGKSTVGRRLAESGLFDFIEEPVGSWQKDFAANLLELFYKDPKRWSFTFQLAAFTTRAKTWTEVLAMTDHQNVVLERSIYCDRYVFADKIVYLRTPAEVCHERIVKRGRKEETKIPLDYLRSLEELHDEWLIDNPKSIVIDGCKQWGAEEIFKLLVEAGVSLARSGEEAAAEVK